MNTVLAYATSTAVVGPLCFVLGVMLSQTVKDWLFNVPPGVRGAMKSVEAKARADIHRAMSDILSKLPVLAEVVEPISLTLSVDGRALSAPKPEGDKA